MRVIFDFDNGTLSWTDVYDIDKNGYAKIKATPWNRQSEELLSLEQVMALLKNYFRSVAEPTDSMKGKIEWPPEQDPVETCLFLAAQEWAYLRFPDYKPVPEHQPRSH